MFWKKALKQKSIAIENGNSQAHESQIRENFQAIYVALVQQREKNPQLS